MFLLCSGMHGSKNIISLAKICLNLKDLSALEGT